MTPRFTITAASSDDLEGVSVLAEHLDTVNLPNEPVAIRALLRRSEDSFSGAIADPCQREYVFALRDNVRGEMVGTSMIIAQLGRRGSPYIYLDVDRVEKYSATLDRHFVHKVLTTRYSYEGPTEIGGLVVHPAHRLGEHRLGTMISFVRFLFLAMRREDFQRQILAELLPPLTDDGTSHLWEALGRRFTGLSYTDADRLSKTNKEFIRGLFPVGEIYATLLSDEAQAVIGEVGAATRGVARMLTRIGFRYAERVDPFDGGPHYVAALDDIRVVADARPVDALRAGAGGTSPFLVGRRYADAPYFAACAAAGAYDGADLELEAAAVEWLDGFGAGVATWCTPLAAAGPPHLGRRRS